MHVEVYVAKAEEWNVRKQLFHASINRVTSFRIQGVHLISPQNLTYTQSNSVREKIFTESMYEL